jgi:hypothetical protein
MTMPLGTDTTTTIVMTTSDGALKTQKTDLPEYQTSETNFTYRRWFQEARLDMFIHWEIYENLGRGEWVLHNDTILLSEYSSLT